jgi:GAF domain-containing protein
MLRELMEVIEAEAACSSSTTPDGESARYSVGEAANARGIEVPGKDLEAVNEGRTLVSHDVKSESGHFAKVDQASGFETRSLVCVPLIVDGKPVGAFEVLNKKNGRRFSSEDATLLETLSLVTALAVRNAVDLRK